VSLQDYYSALDRIKSGQTKFVSSDTKITNDAVSLEAGREKGSIKKSRAIFAGLIKDIAAAAEQQKKSPEHELGLKLLNSKRLSDEYRCLYEAAMSREQSLVAEVFSLRLRLAQITGENVIPLSKSLRAE
jgi:hypothetical protein